MANKPGHSQTAWYGTTENLRCPDMEVYAYMWQVMPKYIQIPIFRNAVYFTVRPVKEKYGH